MVYKHLFILDPSYMQSIKQLRDRPLSLGCMTCLYLYDIFEMFRDEPHPWVVHALTERLARHSSHCMHAKLICYSIGPFLLTLLHGCKKINDGSNKRKDITNR